MWKFEDKGKWENYLHDINDIIENAFQAKKESVTWMERTQKFKITFARLEEEKLGTTETPLKVKRTENGRSSKSS